MNYQESLNYIHEASKLGIKLGLESIGRLLDRLDNPEKELNFIHVAGTNGKGSTCTFLSQILEAGGYKVGLFTSPGLEGKSASIKLNNEEISDECLAEIISQVKEAASGIIADGYEAPSEFEILTAVGFLYFKIEKTDIAVLEVGMGGRYDATNIIKKPLVSVITSISMDHTAYLGDSLEKVAYEKGGIIKDDAPLVLYPQEKKVEDVITQIAHEKNSKIYKMNFDSLDVKSRDLSGQVFTLKTSEKEYEDLKISLLGDHQVYNALTAIRTIEVLNNTSEFKLSEGAIRRGLERAVLPGRFELIAKDPITIIDGAHNIGGAKVFVAALDKYLQDYDINLVIGILADKDFNGFLDLVLPKVSKVITTKPDNLRAMDAEKLADVIREKGKDAVASKSLEDSYNKALAITDKDKEAIVYVGSLYMISDVRNYIKEKNTNKKI